MTLTEAVALVVAELPAAWVDGVVFQVAGSHPDRLRGLYEGVPLPARGGRPVAPSVITVYLDQLMGLTVEHVRHVVVHEVGHHVGFTDVELAAL